MVGGGSPSVCVLAVRALAQCGPGGSVWTPAVSVCRGPRGAVRSLVNGKSILQVEAAKGPFLGAQGSKDRRYSVEGIEALWCRIIGWCGVIFQIHAVIKFSLPAPAIVLFFVASTATPATPSSASRSNSSSSMSRGVLVNWSTPPKVRSTIGS